LKGGQFESSSCLGEVKVFVSNLANPGWASLVQTVDQLLLFQAGEPVLIL
jgi:hypothetical protein